jgi:alkylation response protein AidB-like acyl-CoA dehydrogenase
MAMKPADSQKLLNDVEAFCQEIRPIEELCYVEHRFNDQLVPLARKHDILGMIVPPEYGGRGADTVTYARALARIGREGTDQKRRYLPASCRGDKICAFGLTEPEAGSNPLEMQTTYEKRGDGYVLNGVKYLISNGGIASTIITFGYPIFASTAGASGKQVRGGRISAFILDTDARGFEKEELTAKMGMPTANTAMFEMKDCPVPAGNLLGEEGDGFKIAMGTLVSGRISVASGCLGVIEDCLTEAVMYAKERQQHGKPIARHQLVQEHIAAIEMHRIASESLVLRAAAAKDAWSADPKNAELKSEAELLAAKAKLFAANASWDAADRAVQIFGGRGWSTLYRPGRHLQDTRVCRIYEGTDEILKLKIAAAVLGGKEWEAYK